MGTVEVEVDVRQLAADTVNTLRIRCEHEVKRADRVGHDGRVVVIDGGGHEPSLRVLPDGERAFALGAEAFAEWERIVAAAVGAFVIESYDAGRNEGFPPYIWQFALTGGCLVAFHPDRLSELTAIRREAR